MSIRIGNRIVSGRSTDSRKESVEFKDVSGNPYDNENLANALNSKLDRLIPGQSISIKDDVIDVKTFTFEQGIPSNTWQITHNLNRFPNVSVIDSSGNEIICETIYIDKNNVELRMQSAFSGKAFLN